MSVFSDSDQSISIMGEGYATFDPTMLIGYDLRFTCDSKVQISLENQENQENQEQESKESDPEFRTLRFRVFDKGGEGIGLEEIRVEIFHEKDVGFFLECVIDNTGFQKIVTENNLQVNFSQFEQSLIEMIEKSVKKPDLIHLRLKLTDDYNGVLTFRQTLRLRSIDVFSLQFQTASSEFIRSQVQYRFNQMKMEAQQKVQEIETKFGRLKSKNPQFAEQMRRSVMFAVSTKPKE
ncbi:hypothetical protein M9Y10_024069 [Tritrichomonas musculus]|uniref:Spindle assembly abnormal protein 6 N-terminal domain-containing protein n=1 Tax=Tritrichomonas musculus TaxID=1915356 RepID=A0ABR2KWX2_9EUKA